MMAFEGKVVWITGASSGIGEALAYAFSRRGAKLILSARRESELQRVRDNCPRPTAEPVVLPLDLSDLDSLPSKAQAACDSFGHIDILINNAGIGYRARVIDTLLAVDEAVMRTNYFGTVALTKAVLPHMIARRSGHLVVISSLLGKFAIPYMSAYAASKHALHGFFDSLRSEIAKDNIKVTIICPGYVRTEISVQRLQGDGVPYGKLDDDHDKAISAESCAAAIVRAIRRGKEEANVGGPEKYAVYLNRLFPGVVSGIMKRMAER